MPEATTELTVRSESVQKLYTDYLAGRYSVNRRYQRKLVWTVEEKQSLIDSILRDLPIPLVLVAESSYSGSAGFELIDGMQRLNAIFSFIENEFEVDGYYFDLEALADTKDQRDRGELAQCDPVLSREDSRKVCNYLLPVSIFRAQTFEQIDEIFGRINSGGRRLLGQELRQAGSTSEIAQLVRRFSSRIRGDSSSGEIVALQDMAKLSINNKNLNYGVDVDSIFWIQQRILRRSDVRTSMDEQLVLDILIDCLLDPFLSSGPYTRDSAYGKKSDGEFRDSNINSRLNDRIEAYSPDLLEQDFFQVYDELRAVVDRSGDRFVRLVCGQDSGNRHPRYFHAIFMAFWEMMVQEEMRVADRDKAAGCLRGIGASKGQLNIPVGGGDWTANDKRKNIDAVKGRLRSSFEKNPGHRRDASQFGLASYLETILANSVTEKLLCEIKQGLLDLHESSRSFDANSWGKIVKSISAIGNSGSEAVGYLLIGVADNKDHAERVATLDGVEPVSYRGFEIVGINREAQIRGESVKSYFDWISNKLKGSPIQDNLCSQVASSISLVDYYGLAVVVVKIECRNGPFFHDGKIFERIGSGDSEVPQSDWGRIYRRFF